MRREKGSGARSKRGRGGWEEEEKGKEEEVVVMMVGKEGVYA